MNGFNRILVFNKALQGCHHPIRLGISLAKKFKARLHILHLIPNPLGIEEWGFQIFPRRQDFEKPRRKQKGNFKTS